MALLYEISKYSKNCIITKIFTLNNNNILIRKSYLFRIWGYLDVEKVVLIKHSNISDNNIRFNMEGTFGKILKNYCDLNNDIKCIINVDILKNICKRATFINNLTRPQDVEMINNFVMCVPKKIKMNGIYCSDADNVNKLPNSVKNLEINDSRFQQRKTKEIKLPNNLQKLKITTYRYYIIIYPKTLKIMEIDCRCSMYEKKCEIHYNNLPNKLKILKIMNYQYSCWSNVGINGLRSVKIIEFGNLVSDGPLPKMPEFIETIKIMFAWCYTSKNNIKIPSIPINLKRILTNRISNIDKNNIPEHVKIIHCEK